jgi:hypothetical protein
MITRRTFAAIAAATTLAPTLVGQVGPVIRDADIRLDG